jgi:hypothetical protein
MNDKEQLITKLKILIEASDIKQKKYQEENNYPVDIGCITRETCKMASLVPQMICLGVTFEDCR